MRRYSQGRFWQVHPTCGDRLTNYNVQGLKEQDFSQNARVQGTSELWLACNIMPFSKKCLQRSAGKSCCGTGVPVFGGPSPGERQGGAKRKPQLVDLPSPSWRMQDGYCQGFLNWYIYIYYIIQYILYIHDYIRMPYTIQFLYGILMVFNSCLS